LEESGEGRRKAGKWGMHEKIATKRNRFGIWGRPLRLQPHISYTFWKPLFSDNISIADIMNDEPLKSNRASKLTILKKPLHKFNVFGIIYLRQRRRYMFCPCSFVCLSLCLSACLSLCVQDYSKRRAWIWMKCCVSTDFGTWTNSLTFDPDPDHSPDLHRIFAFQRDT